MKALINSKKRGWTILELVVAVAAAAILAKVAYASYTDFQIRQNREVAKQELMKAATAMEKYYAQNGRYTTADGQWPSGLFGLEVVGSNGVVYTLQMGNGSPNTQDFKIIAVPKAGTIQSNDGDICIDKAGKFVWPSNGQCEIQPEAGDVPVPTTSPSVTPSTAPTPSVAPSATPSVIPSASPSSNPSPSTAPTPSSSPSSTPAPVISPSPQPVGALWCADSNNITRKLKALNNYYSADCDYNAKSGCSGVNIPGNCGNADCSGSDIGGNCTAGGAWPGSCHDSCMTDCEGDCTDSVIRGDCGKYNPVGSERPTDCSGSLVYGECRGIGCK